MWRAKNDFHEFAVIADKRRSKSFGGTAVWLAQLCRDICHRLFEILGGKGS